jgi:hypothetical protein
MWALGKLVLPRRSKFVFTGIHGPTLDWSDIILYYPNADPILFIEGYACCDCSFKGDINEIVNHQKKWHGWLKAWRRFKDS